MEQGEKIFISNEGDDTGFSEEALDRTIELHAGQWLDLSKRKKSPKLSSPQVVISQRQKITTNKSTALIKEKIILQLRAINQDLKVNISDFLDLQDFGSNDAEDKLNTIFDLQTFQKVLLKSLVWVDRGEFNESKLPKQLQNLLK
jgi:hypothetical protein